MARCCMAAATAGETIKLLWLTAAAAAAAARLRACSACRRAAKSSAAINCCCVLLFARPPPFCPLFGGEVLVAPAVPPTSGDSDLKPILPFVIICSPLPVPPLSSDGVVQSEEAAFVLLLTALRIFTLQSLPPPLKSLLLL